LVIFSSDNGPWLLYGDHGGSAGPLREGKQTAWEGGVRVPCLMRLPNQIPAGRVCHEPAMTIDILPTLARLAGAPLPELPIDGLDIWPLIAGPADAQSPHEALYFYWGEELHAVRSGRWKLHLPHPYPKLVEPSPGGGQRGRYDKGRTDLALYDLVADPGEQNNLAAANEEIVTRLLSMAEKARADLGDSLTGRKGANVREPGRDVAQ